MKKLLTTIGLAAGLAGSPSFAQINLDFSDLTSADVTAYDNGTDDSAPIGTEILIFKGISTGIDLRIKTTSSYTAANISNNGLDNSGNFGQINLDGGTSTSFLFSLVDTGTTTLASIDEVAFSFLDLDGTAGLPYESITVGESSLLVLNKDTELDYEISGGETILSATGEAGAENNPKSVVLTETQSKIAGSFIFENTNQFSFTFDAGTTNGNGRNVFFAGDVTFDDPADPIPVPEPSAYGLLIGLVALGFAARRRR